MRDLLATGLLAAQVCFLTQMIVKVRRARSSAGVSLAGEAFWMVAGAGWVAFSIAVGDVLVAISGALAAGGSGLLFGQSSVYSDGREPRNALVQATVVAAGFAISWAVAGADGLGAALAVFGAVQFVPHALTSLRMWARDLPADGLSIPATVLRALYTSAWAAYATGPALWGEGVFSLPLFAWGLSGAVAFSLQAAAGVRSNRLHRPEVTRPDQSATETVEPRIP